ncbi:hypothetical protein DQ04_10691000 [Trypanosoma grayi]|uniref:hypothetical protein n=1 Tax=Trypanosoma grayi TaxID=71804 RepID=UPI0004F44829|nr:hypothetical protein DQ04_10691000 [Trypanosoma grayi]KEG07163.1 hypothetical protein DQ04_10691000 [Trypanosoma grayi]
MFRASLTMCGGGVLRGAGRAGRGRNVVASAEAAASTTPSKMQRRRRAESKEEQKEDSSDFTYTPAPHAHGGAGKPSSTSTSAGSVREGRGDEVLQLAHRMQQRDLTGEVPVASFAYEVLRAHPSVRQMGLRERMSFLCERWERLSQKERKSYLDDPLKGLL